ncbi:MAG: hypothetical protein HY360_24365 [Verrucomicrobia bacterium]|nr:hypothetical protein [Verrucomicrobiota bacterium]
MPTEKPIQVDLIKLASGERLLRLSEPTSGLCLEKKMDPRQPVVRQKERLMKTFAAALSRELTVAA